MRQVIWLLSFALVACPVPGDVGVDPRGVDDDEDGFSENDGDCNDADPLVAPDQNERCDGLDNDCDGEIDGLACAREDTFYSTALLDLLLVVDNTESMVEEQVKLVEAIPDLVAHVVGLGRDVHMGVVTMDMGSPTAGRLVQVDGTLWVDSTWAAQDADRWVQRAVNVGTDGSGIEQGRAAAFAALETHRETDNAGFRRLDADLAIVMLSDENDSSGSPTLDDFVDWLDGGPGLDRATVHAIVEPSSPCWGVYGADHLSLVALTGGTWLSICESAYGPFLSALGQVVVQDALPRRFALVRPADPDTIAVQVELDAGFIDVLDRTRFLYDEVTAEVVVVDDQPPAAGSLVRISYESLP